MEVESLQGQVTQEKELRAVMEGCLMEEKMAWKSVQAELQENSKCIETLSGKLHALRSTLTQEDAPGVLNLPVLLFAEKGNSRFNSQNALRIMQYNQHH